MKMHQEKMLKTREARFHVLVVFSNFFKNTKHRWS